MPTRNGERELTTKEVRELVGLAQKLRETMSRMDGRHQAMVLADTFNLADRVYGLWPDASRPGGYEYTILKGQLGSEAMRRVARNPEISVGAIFQESEDHAEMTRSIYEGLERSRHHNEAYRSAWSLWLGIAPANFEATIARVRGYLRG